MGESEYPYDQDQSAKYGQQHDFPVYLPEIDCFDGTFIHIKNKKGQENLDRDILLSDLPGLGFNGSNNFWFCPLQFRLQILGQSM